MAANLINQLKNEFSDDVIERLASYLGETPARTQTALGYAIPGVAGGLFQKAQTPQGANDLLGLLQRGGFDGTSFGSLASLLRTGDGPADLIRKGGTLLSSLLGPRLGNLTDAIQTASGLGKQSSASLLALAASAVASLTGKEASAAGGLNAASVASVLGAQGPYLAAVAPSGLAQVLGVSSWFRAEEPARAYERAAPVPARAYKREKPSLAWLWALPVLLLALLFFAWRSRPVEAPPQLVSTPAGPVGSRSAPTLVSRALTCGQQIDVAPDGVEPKLIGFIDDASRPVDDTTWFTFDRLEFDTASATVLPGSLSQLRNIAAIMNCYPNVSLKVGGYTDDVGDPASNLKLSQARAENTVAAIVSQGIPASRVEAEGYGEQPPWPVTIAPRGGSATAESTCASPGNSPRGHRQHSRRRCASCAGRAYRPDCSARYVPATLPGRCCA